MSAKSLPRDSRIARNSIKVGISPSVSRLPIASRACSFCFSSKDVPFSSSNSSDVSRTNASSMPTSASFLTDHWFGGSIHKILLVKMYKISGGVHSVCPQFPQRRGVELIEHEIPLWGHVNLESPVRSGCRPNRTLFGARAPGSRICHWLQCALRNGEVVLYRY